MNKKGEKVNYAVLGIVAIVAIVAIAQVLNGSSITGAATRGKSAGCTTIQSGEIEYESPSCGDFIPKGYDDWGHNYQAHIFNGKYCDNYCDAGWCQAYKDVDLQIKWNEAWLSNVDCDGDNILDRPTDNGGTYVGSGAWTTNHMKDTYVGSSGEKCQYEYFVKIVAKPYAGYDCSADGGYEIWTDFCVIQEVYNDPCGGYTGKLSLVTPAGLGYWTK